MAVHDEVALAAAQEQHPGHGVALVQHPQGRAGLVGTAVKGLAEPGTLGAGLAAVPQEGRVIEPVAIGRTAWRNRRVELQYQGDRDGLMGVASLTAVMRVLADPGAGGAGLGLGAEVFCV